MAILNFKVIYTLDDNNKESRIYDIKFLGFFQKLKEKRCPRNLDFCKKCPYYEKFNGIYNCYDKIGFNMHLVKDIEIVLPNPTLGKYGNTKFIDQLQDHKFQVGDIVEWHKVKGKVVDYKYYVINGSEYIAVDFENGLRELFKPNGDHWTWATKPKLKLIKEFKND